MSHKKSFLFWIALSIFGVGIFLFLSIHYLFDPRLYQESLQKTFTLHLQREVSFGKAKMNLWGGVGVALEDFRVRDRSLTFDLFRSKKLILTARLLPLLKREIKWKRIILDRPVLRLVRDKNGRLNLSDAPLNGEELKSAQQRILQTLATLFGGSLSIREGRSPSRMSVWRNPTHLSKFVPLISASQGSLFKNPFHSVSAEHSSNLTRKAGSPFPGRLRISPKRWLSQKEK